MTFKALVAVGPQKKTKLPSNYVLKLQLQCCEASPTDECNRLGEDGEGSAVRHCGGRKDTEEKKRKRCHWSAQRCFSVLGKLVTVNKSLQAKCSSSLWMTNESIARVDVIHAQTPWRVFFSLFEPKLTIAGAQGLKCSGG